MKIINKRKPNNWVKFDRSLMRDKRLKSHHKIIYLLFCSLSESCENIYPSYSWIAEEVGYSYNGKHKVGSKEYDSALQQFVATNLEPLIKLGWIKKINNKGGSCDYEVFDHDCDPQEKSSNPPKKNLGGDPQEKSSISYKSIKLKETSVEPQPQNLEKKEELESFKNNPFYLEHKATRFPDLTDKEIDLKIKSFICDRNFTKFELMMTVLAEENQRVLKARKTNEWNKPNQNQPNTNNQNQNIETFSWSLTGRTYINHLKRVVYYDPVDFDYNTEKINKFLEKYNKLNYTILN